VNKKGYTLVEIIAVLVIIALIATIVILNFDNSIEKTNTKKEQAFVNDLQKAACVYIDLIENATYKQSCYSSNLCTVSASQLILSGMISDDLIDPTTNTKIAPTLSVNVTWDSEGTKTCTLNR
jgi:prepilin-type N-terminal cleavage/methylation domain-containing protein